MVNESDRGGTTEYRDASYYIVAVFPWADILKGVSINDWKILYIQSVYAIDVAHHIVVGFGQTIGLGI